jgi:hypothetical protein
MENLRDWGEIVTLRGSVGIGARADFRLGGLMHPGLGLTAGVEAGLCHGPYAGVHGTTDFLAFHSEQCQNLNGEKGDGAVRDCICAGIALPMVTCKGDYPWIQVADVEVSVFAGVVGVGVGISFGELLDAVVNLFGVDLDPVGDDKPEKWKRPRPKDEEDE